MRVEVRLHGERQDAPPKMVSVDYELIVDTNESDQRLALICNCLDIVPVVS
ncbi:hypothetical protein [Allomesorhizobium camelthorni]|uniref:Uncharacterized protein n=1 Tax=Allomesorhizobium camelthorni TaxID=475069 RepID=A0A6G4WPM5_9HYPH|nr:hypothetical protein [Mesorhizobium camelthorni]NGO56156.1 hypothetical protein [Mesorhizobium camelthorni]